jgi:hypothetical protein
MSFTGFISSLHMHMVGHLYCSHPQLRDSPVKITTAGSTITLHCEWFNSLLYSTELFCSFVDRDMFMRCPGGGIGHKATQNVSTRQARQQHEYPDETRKQELEIKEDLDGEAEAPCVRQV